MSSDSAFIVALLCATTTAPGNTGNHSFALCLMQHPVERVYLKSLRCSCSNNMSTSNASRSVAVFFVECDFATLLRSSSTRVPIILWGMRVDRQDMNLLYRITVKSVCLIREITDTDELLEMYRFFSRERFTSHFLYLTYLYWLYSYHGTRCQENYSMAFLNIDII